MMTQGVLPFKYEKDKQGCGMTALGGLPTYLDLAYRAGLPRSIERHIRIRAEGQGWTDSEVILSLLMLNLAGGQSVEDLNGLEGDEGFCRVLGRISKHGLTRKQRRALGNRWRKEKRRAVPSPSAVFRYLAGFHEEDEEKLRHKGKAFIPRTNEHLGGFRKVNRDFLSFVQKHDKQERATIDMDGTLVETHKREALNCYEGYKAYQPHNMWWSEQGMVLHTEFRDGNVPAGFEQLRVLKEGLRSLPEGVKRVRLRSDAAGYQHNLMRYCELGKDRRFGRIEFGISCPVTPEFKKAVSEVKEGEWKALRKKKKGKKVETKRQWAEVCFVPNAIGHSKKGPEYRYIAIREPIQDQLMLPGMEQDDKALPYQTMYEDSIKYKVFGIVTNMDWAGQQLIEWVYKRCGKSEEAHSIMKEDLAGGKLPSEAFGQNAAWWWIMILALNLNAAMKSLVLGKAWICKRMKAIRFSLINLPARVMERSRQLFVRVSQNHPCFQWLVRIRAKIATLSPAPCG